MMTIEPVFCQNCGRLCKEVHEGSNGLPYCSHDCEITDRLIVEYEWAIFLTVLLVIGAMVLTAYYMATKYSPTAQEQMETNQGEWYLNLDAGALRESDQVCICSHR